MIGAPKHIVKAQDSIISQLFEDGDFRLQSCLVRLWKSKGIDNLNGVGLARLLMRGGLDLGKGSRSKPVSKLVELLARVRLDESSGFSANRTRAASLDSLTRCSSARGLNDMLGGSVARAWAIIGLLYVGGRSQSVLIVEVLTAVGSSSTRYYEVQRDRSKFTDEILQFGNL